MTSGDDLTDPGQPTTNVVASAATGRAPGADDVVVRRRPRWLLRRAAEPDAGKGAATPDALPDPGQDSRPDR